MQLHASPDSTLPFAHLRSLLDRIDLHIQVPAVKYKELAEEEKSEESAVIRERILAARQHQFRRLEPFGIFCNAQMTPVR